MKPGDDDRTLSGVPFGQTADELGPDSHDATIVKPTRFNESASLPSGLPRLDADGTEGGEPVFQRVEVTRLMDTSAIARPHGGEAPGGARPGNSAAPARPPGPWPGPSPGPSLLPPPPPHPSDRVLLPPAAKPGLAPSPDIAPLPGWVLPYVIGAIALVLVGALVLWTQARILGHF